MSVHGLLIAACCWALLIALILVWFRFAAYHDDDLPQPGDDLAPPEWAYIDTRDEQ